MGLYQALIEAEPTFRESLAPTGYISKEPKWLIELAKIGHRERIRIKKCSAVNIDLPDRQRSGSPKMGTNEKPYLCADFASYVFGVDSNDGIRSQQFINIHKKLLKFCRNNKNADRYTDSEQRLIQEEVIPALRRMLALIGLTQDQRRGRLPDGITFTKKDLISFSTPSRHLADYRIVSDFWEFDLGAAVSNRKGRCGISHNHFDDTEESNRDLLQTIPFSSSLFGYSAIISSIDEGKNAFESANKTQLGNASICKECGMKAVAVLNHLIQRDKQEKEDGSLVLLKSGTHCVVLAQDPAGKRPLANQMAVFWSRDEITAQPNGDESETSNSLTEAVRISLDDLDEITESSEEILPTARSGHLRNFLESPWYCKGSAVETLNPIPFYFAILSPNKSRLAIREWIETDVSTIRDTLLAYRRAIEIIDPVTGETIAPALRTVLESLRAPAVKEKKHDEKPRLAEIEPELTRQLVRTMYTGSAPPDALLRRALQAFSLPDSAKGSSAERLNQRRTALAAAIKLVLTYNDPTNAKAMTKLKTEHDESCAYKKESPYLCGRVFSILSEIQKRASSSGRGVNATVVDKFYSAAATAPQSVLGSLLTKASVGHLPKLRKDPSKAYTRAKDQGGVPLDHLLTETVALLDAACGPERQHTPRQQAEFALGYHHQLAEFMTKTK